MSADYVYVTEPRLKTTSAAAVKLRLMTPVELSPPRQLRAQARGELGTIEHVMRAQKVLTTRSNACLR